MLQIRKKLSDGMGKSPRWENPQGKPSRIIDSKNKAFFVFCVYNVFYSIAQN
jgi:nitrous oxide reductase accessory protein NosL